MLRLRACGQQAGKYLRSSAAAWTSGAAQRQQQMHLLLETYPAARRAYRRLIPAAVIAVLGTAVLASDLAPAKAECQSSENPAGDSSCSCSSSIADFLKDLRLVLREDQIDLDPKERASRGKPWNSYHPVQEIPQVIVLPESTEDVSNVVKLCGKHGIPVVPFGGGTSLEGQTVAMKGGLSMDFNRMKHVISLNEHDLDITVQAGLGYIELNDLLRPKGLWFPLDPGPGASIGGMCACRCSGSTAVRYGSMRENVLSLTAVLANGEIIKTASRARKSSAGYDLTRLLIGSEGTLAIITEATLKVYGIPKVSRALRICYPSSTGVSAAASTAKDTLNCGVSIGRCELLDEAMVRVINRAHVITDGEDEQATLPKTAGPPWPESTVLLYELTGLSEASVAEQARVVVDIARKHGAVDITFFESEEDCREVWRTRKECLWSAMSVYSDYEPMITDVCVPLTQLPALITESQAAIAQSGLPCPIIAHAGDGNFHVLIFFRPEVPEEVQAAKKLADSMAIRAIELDGTCSGEHGIGTGKKHLLRKELNAATLQVMQDVKNTFDPQQLLNPGKVVDLPQAYPEFTTRRPLAGRSQETATLLACDPCPSSETCVHDHHDTDK